MIVEDMQKAWAIVEGVQRVALPLGLHFTLYDNGDGWTAGLWYGWIENLLEAEGGDTPEQAIRRLGEKMDGLEERLSQR